MIMRVKCKYLITKQGTIQERQCNYCHQWLGDNEFMTHES